MTQQSSLYLRLGGYDGLVAFVDDLLPRVEADEKLGRFWAHRSHDGLARERQLLIDYLVEKAGGSLLYTGRDMLVSHKGMGIGEEDWQRFLGHAVAAMNALNVPDQEQQDVAAFVASIKDQIVEA